MYSIRELTGNQCSDRRMVWTCWVHTTHRCDSSARACGTDNMPKTITVTSHIGAYRHVRRRHRTVHHWIAITYVLDTGTLLTKACNKISDSSPWNPGTDPQTAQYSIRNEERILEVQVLYPARCKVVKRRQAVPTNTVWQR